jgi:hypothetical protein
MPSLATAEGSGQGRWTWRRTSRAGELSCIAQPAKGWPCRPVRLAPGRFRCLRQLYA